MKELFTIWTNTRGIVLISVCAAVYVAVLLPFKFFTIVPGLTEFRPGAALPIFLSFLFGPAAAWGSAIGNLVGDLLGGMFGPGSFFGFWGNFLMGYIPYRFWRTWTGRVDPRPQKGREWVLYVAIVLLASAACGLVIGWGAHVLKLFPFVVLGNVISINNFLVSIILTTALVFAASARIGKWNMLYDDILEPKQISGFKYSKIGSILLAAAIVGGMVLANWISIANLGADLGQPDGSVDLVQTYQEGVGQYFGKVASIQSVGWGTAPAIALLIAALIIL